MFYVKFSLKCVQLSQKPSNEFSMHIHILEVNTIQRVQFCWSNFNKKQRSVSLICNPAATQWIQTPITLTRLCAFRFPFISSIMQPKEIMLYNCHSCVPTWILRRSENVSYRWIYHLPVRIKTFAVTGATFLEDGTGNVVWHPQIRRILLSISQMPDLGLLLRDPNTAKHNFSPIYCFTRLAVWKTSYK